VEQDESSANAWMNGLMSTSGVASRLRRIKIENPGSRDFLLRSTTVAAAARRSCGRGGRHHYTSKTCFLVTSWSGALALVGPACVLSRTQSAIRIRSDHRSCSLVRTCASNSMDDVEMTLPTSLYSPRWPGWHWTVSPCITPVPCGPQVKMRYPGRIHSRSLACSESAL